MSILKFLYRRPSSRCSHFSVALSTFLRELGLCGMDHCGCCSPADASAVGSAQLTSVWGGLTSVNTVEPALALGLCLKKRHGPLFASRCGTREQEAFFETAQPELKLRSHNLSRVR